MTPSSPTRRSSDLAISCPFIFPKRCNHHRVIASEAKQSRAVTARSGLPRRLRLLAMTSRTMETMVFHLRYFRNDPKAYLVLNRQTPPGTNASGQATKDRTRRREEGRGGKEG